MARTTAARLRALDWTTLEAALSERGWAKVEGLLDAAECSETIALWDEPARWRSRVEMARHRFGEGEYRYFADPLPRLVRELRIHSYRHLAPIANRWMEALGEETRFPNAHADLLERCRDAGQTKPTPLLLRYETGGYNCLHQDLYGSVAFPLQVAFFLSRPGRDYTGGEFVLVENRPRAQSRAEAIATGLGDAVIFTTRVRPARGARGVYRAQIRHGVSRVLSGTRFTLGVIFHDAR
jgi:hypothetical protein